MTAQGAEKAYAQGACYANADFKGRFVGAQHCNVRKKEGYEADDIIGTISRICDGENVECYIVTGDRDDLQLASKKTQKFFSPSPKAVRTKLTAYDEDAVFEKNTALRPKKFIDVKALMGDSSDNIPGVAGIGEKPRSDLFKKIRKSRRCFCARGRKTQRALPKSLPTAKDSAYLSYTLAKNRPFCAR
ncbi:MAG: hypothetical protein L6V93_16815 [Clostridiales bacterium]|nr:MAG: hypothetical protein L6V93_16815 [Clostridiales bacterium]